ncbi:MAG: SPFH domain-containing protein [Agathobacter sp.]|nr:SPFH domain-containing protein [Agathobacter sp.]
MGIIKATMQAISGGFSDQYLEKIVPYDMGAQTVFTYGVVENSGDNKKRTDNVISNGSKIQVYDNQMMLLVDGGKVVDYTAEPGLYEVSNSSMPSLFNGQFGDSLKEAFNRVRFGGGTPQKQEVFYINLQEIKDIKFGTRNPINYFDNMYNAELFLRAHGTYSIKIVNPLQFYAEVIPRNSRKVEITDINEQYISEFLGALQAAINQMSADGVRISHVPSKALELGKYMADILDQDWNQMRGMVIQAVGIASLSYDEKSQELINTRNEGAMLSDPTIAQGYMVKNMSEGIKNAGSNSAGAMQGFMGVGIGASAMGNMMNGFTQMSQNLQGQQPVQGAPGAGMSAGAVAGASAGNTAANSWTCECGATNTGKFCSNCGKPAPTPATEWTCECGATNTGKFCSNCGKPAPAAEWTCECGATNKGNFCSNCGKPRA